jgi:hypothetical protein
MTAKLCGPGGVRAVIAENLLVKQQLIVVRRARQRAPNLTLTIRRSARRLAASARGISATGCSADSDRFSSVQGESESSARHLDEAKRLGVAKHSGLNRMAHEHELFTVSIALGD